MNAQAKKIIASIAMTSMLIGMSAPALASFTDIQNHWSRQAVEYVTEHHLFQGTSADIFSPDMPMTRGMFVTVLGRLAQEQGSTISEGDITFSDITSSDYYYTYIKWAAKMGLVNGVGEGRFAPNALITREQMCVIVVKFLETVLQYDLQAFSAQTTFMDTQSISNWATQYVGKAQAIGLVQGTQTANGVIFAPSGYTTRGAAATVFKNLDMLIINWNVGVLPGQTEGSGTGSSGSGTSGGDSQEHSAEEIATEATVALNLQTMYTNYLALRNTYLADDTVWECMDLLMGCISDALAQRKAGAFLSKAYITNRYANKITQLKNLKDTLSDAQENQLYNIIVRLDTTQNIYQVMDYFNVTI